MFYKKFVVYLLISEFFFASLFSRGRKLKMCQRKTRSKFFNPFSFNVLLDRDSMSRDL